MINTGIHIDMAHDAQNKNNYDEELFGVSSS